jgi:AhpD family alkylhydroperoxidase
MFQNAENRAVRLQCLIASDVVDVRRGVAFTTECAYCIDTHTKRARAHSASKQEIAETVFVAATMRVEGTLAHALLALRLFDEDEKSA